MRISSVEVIPYALPFREPYVTARGSLTEREIVLLRVRDGSGVEGLGEAVPLSLRGGETLSIVVEELRRWGQTPDADPASLSSPSRCAIDSALLDLRSRREAVPAWQALGAASAAPVECNATLVAAEPALIAEQASAWAAEGFVDFKLKVGAPGDIEQVRAVRRELGDQARLRVDANGVWSVEQALTRLEAMHGEGVFLAEQPCETLEQMAKVRERCEMWISADESITTPTEAEQAIGADACHLVTVKLSKVGGIEEALAISASLPTYLSSALDGPLGIAAAAHAAQALRESGRDAGIAHGLATQRLFASTIASVECVLRGDMLHLPDGPGLGVEIDEEALAAHRI